MTAPSRIDRLLAALGPAAAGLTGRELAETLWLAMAAGPLGRSVDRGRTPAPPTTGEPAPSGPGGERPGPELPRTAPPSALPLGVPATAGDAN